MNSCIADICSAGSKVVAGLAPSLASGTGLPFDEIAIEGPADRTLMHVHPPSRESASL